MTTDSASWARRARLSPHRVGITSGVPKPAVTGNLPALPLRALAHPRQMAPVVMAWRRHSLSMRVERHSGLITHPLLGLRACRCHCFRRFPRRSRTPIKRPIGRSAPLRLPRDSSLGNIQPEGGSQACCGCSSERCGSMSTARSISCEARPCPLSILLNGPLRAANSQVKHMSVHLFHVLIGSNISYVAIHNQLPHPPPMWEQTVRRARWPLFPESRLSRSLEGSGYPDADVDPVGLGPVNYRVSSRPGCPRVQQFPLPSRAG